MKLENKSESVPMNRRVCHTYIIFPVTQYPRNSISSPSKTFLRNDCKIVRLLQTYQNTLLQIWKQQIVTFIYGTK